MFSARSVGPPEPDMDDDVERLYCLLLSRAEAEVPTRRSVPKLVPNGVKRRSN